MDPKTYLQLFTFRGDTFSEQGKTQEDGYKRIFRRPTIADLESHFSGKKVLALYPAMNKVCYLGAIDLDISHDKADSDEEWALLSNNLVRVIREVRGRGVTSFGVEKTGGRGYHIWVFSELVSTTQMRDLLTDIIDGAGVEAEIFPSDSETGIGKAIRPPLGHHNWYSGHSVMLDPDTLKEIVVNDDILTTWLDSRLTETDFEALGFHKSIYKPQTNDLSLKYTDVPQVIDFNELLETIRPCFQHVYNEGVETTGGEGWSMMTAAAAELFSNGGTLEHVHKFFSTQEHYKYETTNKHLRPIMRKSIAPFRCATLRDRCGRYVKELCEKCYIQKQDYIEELLDKTVDKSKDKEIPEDGMNPITQFQFVGMELENILGDGYSTLLMNTFNSGKTWSVISLLKRLMSQGGRANFILPNNNLKKQVIERLDRAGVSYLDNPNNLSLCARGDEFKELGYVPSIVCKSCRLNSQIRELTSTVFEDYLQTEGPFKGNATLYHDWGNRYGTCGKWVYLTLLELTTNEPLVLLMNDQKLRHHLFIPNTPLLPAIKSELLFCNIIEQIDFINRTIPRISFSMDRIRKSLRLLGMLKIDEIDEAAQRLTERLEESGIYPEDHSELEALDYITQYVHVLDGFQAGEYRRIIHNSNSDIVSFDVAGNRLLRPILNDVGGKNINPRLYDSTIDYISNLEVEYLGMGGAVVVPSTLQECLEIHSSCGATLGITSTPSGLEYLNQRWRNRYEESKNTLLKNLYSIPSGGYTKGESHLADELDGRSIVFSRKCENSDYINDGLVRGNTHRGGDIKEVVIDSLQFPRHAEQKISDLIQICGGNIGDGVRLFYQGLVSDALTQAHKFKAERILVPNPEIFTSLGFVVHTDDTLGDRVYMQKLKDRIEAKGGGVYRHQVKGVPDDILARFVQEGLLAMNGKKYILGKAL